MRRVILADYKDYVYAEECRKRGRGRNYRNRTKIMGAFMQIYSYDIFDTILYRSVPRPCDVFVKMACTSEFKQILNVQPKRFAQARRNCETMLRHMRKKEVSIDDIYREIGKKFKISQEAAYALQSLEFSTEMKGIFVNKKVVEEITALLLRKESVILISDMYWNGEAIRKLLVNNDEIFKNIEIYSSCDWNASKEKGTLFSIVREKKKGSYEHWQHVGDNPYSDYKVPQNLGIKCILMSKLFAFDYEKHLNIEDESIREIYATISQVRQQYETEAYGFGVSFAAPMVYQYVEWVLAQAIANDIQVLYFVLRDGYILQKVANEIIESRHLSIKAKLLFGSRVAWRFPEVTPEKLENLSVWEKSNWIFRDPSYAYVPFERLGFHKSELTELFGSEFAEIALHSFHAFKVVLDKALKNEVFCQRLKEKVQTAGENLYQYLRQTLDINKKIAFVDTNSTGKTQHDLNIFLAKRDPNSRPIAFFYHTYLSDKKPMPNLQHVFIRADQSDKRFPEALFRAPYNPCYGYGKGTDGSMQPVFFDGAYNAWFGGFCYDEYLDGVIQFTKAIETKKKTQKLDFSAYVDFLMHVANFDLVSKDELRIVERLPFNPDLYGNEVLEFYPEIHCRDIFHPFTKLIYFPKGSFYRAGGIWPYLYAFLFALVKLKRKMS